MDVSSRRNHIFLQLDEDYEGWMKVTSPHWLQHLWDGEPVQELLLRQGCLPSVSPEIETNWKFGEKKNQVKFNCKWGESHVSRFQTALYPCVDVGQLNWSTGNPDWSIFSAASDWWFLCSSPLLSKALQFIHFNNGWISVFLHAREDPRWSCSTSLVTIPDSRRRLRLSISKLNNTPHEQKANALAKDYLFE